MAVLDFPNNPILDQVWNAPSGAAYIFDGTVWVALSGGGSGGGAAPPPGGALVTVTHDPTLSGEGTAAYPLAVAPTLASDVY